MSLRRPCTLCNDYFQPAGKSGKFCESCLKKRKVERSKRIGKISSKTKEDKKKQYFLGKEELDKIRDNATLQKWKILSKNLKLGKTIWVGRFTMEKLAEDMGMPYTTVQRCLSLDRCNERNWALHKEGKITSFKLAMICSLKNNKLQDRIVDAVIEDNLSTCQIKEFKVDNIKDMNKVRHKLAVEKGYSCSGSAYIHFNNWINRGRIFILMDKEKLPKARIPELEKNLKGLKKLIDQYIKL